MCTVDQSLPLHAIEGGVHGADGHRTLRPLFDIGTDGYPVGFFLQAGDGQECDLLELTDKGAA